MTLVLHASAMNQQEKTFSGFKHIFQASKALKEKTYVLSTFSVLKNDFF